MDARAKLFGHPVHQMLIVFPLGLLIAAVAFDLVYFLTGDASFANVAYWNIVGGLVMGALAAVFGAIDWTAIPRGTRAKRIGLLHGLGNLAIIALFAAAWSLRAGDPQHLPTGAIFTLEVVAVALGAVTAWLGGELVDRLGVGVHEGAHVDAPSSLAERSATAR